MGQPDIENADSIIRSKFPQRSAFSPTRRWEGKVKGLDEFPQDQWPDNIPLLYFSYHIMVGLGTLMLALMVWALSELWRGTLFTRRKPLLWVLMLAFPFPYIATTSAG